MPIVECVPNLSCGDDPVAIARVASCFQREGVALLDIDTSPAANRTVFTVVGEIDELVDAAVDAAICAAEVVDLRTHRGIHVRMGALDVLPFVPLEAFRPDGGTMSDAFTAARMAGDRIGASGIPVYFYGEAASRPHRRLLHEVRRDGFEGLAARLAADPPDRGPERPHPSAGASAVGAREVLVAFNVSLTTKDVAIAQQIAREVRELRSVKRDAYGRVVSSAPGRLPGVRAIGWYTGDFDRAQVSCNLTDWRRSPPHVVYAAIREEARRLGVDVSGSELIGCVPLEALRLAAAAEGVYREEDVVAAAVAALGLDRDKPFPPERKVLDTAIVGALGRFE